MASKHLFKTSVTSNSSTQREELGAVRREWNASDGCFKVYKYIKASLVASAANGTALTFQNTLGTIVQDLASGTAYGKANKPAGVAVGTLTNAYYGWIQIGGYHSAVKTNGDDDIADGASVIVATNTNGTVDSVASGTASSIKILGVAVAADVDASDTVAVLLDCSYGDIIQ